MDAFQIRKNRSIWDLKPGFYLYFGSALGKTSTSLKYRLSRHFKSEKKIFWHIDLLTSSRNVEKIQAYNLVQNKGLECEKLHEFKKKYTKGKIVKNFGSSDCKLKCGGHLLYLSNNQKELSSLHAYFQNNGWSKFIFNNRI
jgi:Uri superfamily endonuclease